MHAGPSMASRIPQSPPKLSGMAPGILDYTQRDRLCRGGSKLSFASFDPHTASPNLEAPDLDNLSLNERLYRPKRVVIETTPSGVSSWRFVPSARREEGVLNEGNWPRVVDICGKYFECSQEQWDIYKLDPLYDCLVKAPPNVPVITPVTEHPQTVPPPAFGKKRRVSSPTEETRVPFPKARRRKVEIQTESEHEQSEVEEMIIDDGLQRHKLARPNDRAKKHKDEKIVMDRKERQERMARRMERLAQQGNGEAEFTFTAPADRSPSVPVFPAIGKRKVTSLFDSLRTNGDQDTEPTLLTDEKPLRNTMNYVTTKNAKRTRTVSPSAAKRNLAAGRQAREKHKAEYRRQEHEARRLAREAELLEELYRNNPDVEMQYASEATAKMESESDEEVNAENEFSSSDEDADDEEAARQAAIAESRRKLAELEADRPLWEEAAAKRKEQERGEAEAKRQQAEAKKRAEEAERREQAAKERREREEQWRREEEEAYRKAREEAARRHAEQERRRQAAKRERDSWSHGYWTAERAKERYSKLADRFDKTKYSPDELPLTADEIPWPMLSRDFDLEDVTWQAVAEFFNAIQPTMTTMEFKKFIIKSHLRFHTDRWASRRLLESVKDEAERGCIEIANKMVIQQLTPIWEGVCGKKVEHPH